MIAVEEPVKYTCSGQIIPHGGSLVNRLVPSAEAPSILNNVVSFPSIELSSRQFADVAMIAIGAYSPLQGFLTETDYNHVVSDMHLADGTLWPVPIALSVDVPPRIGEFLRLARNGATVAVLRVESVYRPDKNKEARLVYGTEDRSHPGVVNVLAQRDWYVGGRIDVLPLPALSDFPKYDLTPRDTRRLFRSKNWKTVVGFQTRNPMHRAHEQITKTALEKVGGLLIHPLVGETKQDDIPAPARMASYEVLIDKYYPHDRVALAVYPGNMFFAGPREAALHAITRQNYGCTHFIVGRDHAGVASYYAPTAAMDFMKTLTKELAIEPIFFEAAAGISGTKVREMLRTGQTPPEDVMRPEVARVLMEALRP